MLPHISGDITPRSESNDALERDPGLVCPPLFQEHLAETKVGINIGRPKADSLTEGPDGFSPSSQAGVGDTEILVHLREVCLIVKGLPKVFDCLGLGPFFQISNTNVGIGPRWLVISRDLQSPLGHHNCLVRALTQEENRTIIH